MANNLEFMEEGLGGFYVAQNGKTRNKRGKGLVKRFGLNIKKNAHEKLEASMGRKPSLLNWISRMLKDSCNEDMVGLKKSLSFYDL